MKAKIDAKIVPWRTINGERLLTNGYEEEALGLVSPMIVGWCKQGFYVGEKYSKEEVRKLLSTVDWRRFKLVKDNFEMKPEHGTAVFLDTGKYFITVERYQSLVRACVRGVPNALFESRVEAAKRRAKERYVAMAGNGNFTRQSHASE